MRLKIATSKDNNWLLTFFPFPLAGLFSAYTFSSLLHLSSMLRLVQVGSKERFENREEFLNNISCFDGIPCQWIFGNQDRPVLSLQLLRGLVEKRVDLLGNGNVYIFGRGPPTINVRMCM